MKLYVVVSAALSAGLKAAQAIHAFRQFVGEYPHLEQYWYHESNNIVVLQTDDLPALADDLSGKGLRLCTFREPDLEDQLTALCVEPNAANWLSTLPLAT